MKTLLFVLCYVLGALVSVVAWRGGSQTECILLVAVWVIALLCYGAACRASRSSQVYARVANNVAPGRNQPLRSGLVTCGHQFTDYTKHSDVRMLLNRSESWEVD
jgi:hypothetical protein